MKEGGEEAQEFESLPFQSVGEEECGVSALHCRQPQELRRSYILLVRHEMSQRHPITTSRTCCNTPVASPLALLFSSQASRSDPG